MTQELIKRLREPKCESYDVGSTGVTTELLDWDVLDEAANLLEQQAAEIERLTDINRDALSNLNELCDTKNAEIDAFKAENDKLSDLWSIMKADRDEALAKLAAMELAHYEEQPDGTIIPVDPSEQALQVARLHFGHAQGHYMGKCIRCDADMDMVDKRCRVCVDCADKSIAAHGIGGHQP